MEETINIWMCSFCGRPDAECMKDASKCERFIFIKETINWGNGPSHNNEEIVQ